MKSVVIVGGSGFIGTHVAQRLTAAGLKVTVFDLVEPRKGSHAQAVRGDVFKAEEIEAGIRGSETVIDLVGLADIGECQKHPDRSFRLNVDSLIRILEAARKEGIRRVVFPSSAAVYGKVETVPIDESATPNPSTVYGWHKMMGEMALRAYRQNYGIGYVILRLFNVVGTGNRGVIHSYVQGALAGKAIRGFGRDQLRDFVDAGDVAEAFRLAATQSDVVDKIINIGSGEGIRISELAAMVGRAVPGTAIEFEEKPDFIPYHAVADITLARKLLAFRPTSARDVVAKLIKDLVAHGG